MTDHNPANDIKVSEIPEGYIPMSAPVQRLQVPEVPGFKLHWFRGEPGRIARAQRAGYRFVENEEVRVNNFDLGGDKSVSGNTDLGTRVSIEAGEEGDGRLYLMKIPQELYDYGQKLLQDDVDSIVDALTAGTIGSKNESASDKNKRYRKGGKPDLFTKKI